jgi:hypothetical protein
MNPFTHSARARAGAVIACLAVTGLALSACGGSSNSGSSGSSNAGSSTSKSPSSSTTSTSSASSSSVVASNSLPFPIAVGDTWVYNSTVAITGTGSTVTDKVLSITPVSGGNEVTMANTDSITNDTTDVTYIFHSNGYITYPSNDFGSGTVVKGGILLPPASVIASGQTTTSTLEVQIHNSSLNETVNANIAVKGDGTASVTEPAGSYSATIVQMTETFKVLGTTETTIVKTWMASGVGPVQSEATIDTLGHTETVSELKLVSFTQG